jgi:DNA-binding response OmpR family regulator
MVNGVPELQPSGRILIVEGGDVRARIVQHFALHGWQVRESATLQDAIAAAQADQPHVIVTALVLPDTSGFGFARALRVVIDHDVLVLAIASDPDAPLDDARRAGFDAVFEMPLDLDQLEVAARAGDEHRRTQKMPRLRD